MTEKVFLDIGAHTGETLAIARDARWGFTQIHSFEPAQNCWPNLNATREQDQRVTVHPVGLWDQPGHLCLHGAGTIGGSFFDRGNADTALVETVDTSTYLNKILPDGAAIIGKVNVEGAELEVLRGLQRLLETRRDLSLDGLLVHVDADKLIGHERRAHAARAIIRSLPNASADHAAFFGPTVQAKTRNWLRHVLGSSAQRTQLQAIERPAHALRVAAWHLKQRTRIKQVTHG